MSGSGPPCGLPRHLRSESGRVQLRVVRKGDVLERLTGPPRPSGAGQSGNLSRQRSPPDYYSGAMGSLIDQLPCQGREGDTEAKKRYAYHGCDRFRE